MIHTIAYLMTMAAAVVVLASSPARAQDARIGGETWAMERLSLVDGRSVSGLIEDERKTSVEFIEVRRRTGKPMYLIVRTIDRNRIKAIHRLDEAAREQLRQRLHVYRNRARIESQRAEAVALTTFEENGLTWREYTGGEWFHLRTTLEEPAARRIAVRLDQVFQAYRQVLPPRLNKRPKRLVITVYGTRAGYIESLRREGIEILNPAFFDPKGNRVLAGCAVNELLTEMRATHEAHRETEDQLRLWDREFSEMLKQRDRGLRAQEVPNAERERILSALRANWTRQQRETQRAVKQAEQRNREKLKQEKDDLLRLLFHETMHAYLENYVYDRETFDVPSWLNEGLAQVFEAARIEADLMRIDAPDPERLARLRTELQREDRLSLSELLESDAKVFLVPHSDNAVTSDRHYLVAWGVTYYLAFEQPLVGTDKLDAYVARDNAEPAVKRFEQFVGRSMTAFETAWRETMLAIPNANGRKPAQ